MPESYSGVDQWDDPVDLLLDGELYTKVTFQDGEIKKIMNRTTWLRARLAQIVKAQADDDVTAIGRGATVDSFTTTGYVSSASIKVVVPNLKAGDIVALDGSVLIAGDASSSALLHMHDGTAAVPGWRFCQDFGIPDGGSKDGGLPVIIRALYAVASDASITFTLQGRKMHGGDDGFSTYNPWNLSARVYRP